MFTRIGDFDRMFGAMDLLRNKMDRMFYDFDRQMGYKPRWSIEPGMPRTTLCDNGDSFEIKAEVPGVTKEDLNVKIQGNYLEIGGTRNPDAPEGYSVHRTERGALSFSRSFTLPADVDAAKVEATLSEGILYLTLPKAEIAKPRQITVN